MEENEQGTSISEIFKNLEINEESPDLKFDIEEDELEPLMSSEEWSDFVINKFSEDELIDGNPNIEGLRRVARLLIGNIVKSAGRIIQAPNPGNDYSATCEHEIVFLSDRELPHETLISYTEVADVNSNVIKEDNVFRRSASSTASTKAEARALRKALMLKRVIAAEELVDEETGEESPTITKSQISYIKNICERNDINVFKYINSGKSKYETIDEIPYTIASRMIGVLSGYQANQSKIPEAIKGYDNNWRK